LKVLIVKLSSLGDVLHTLPVVNDIKTAFPNAQIDWVVDRTFAGVVRQCLGVNKVITCELRQWRKTPFSQKTKQAWRIFKVELQQEKYDAVIDLQGLTKSAAVAWFAKLSPAGKRYAMANRTEGSSYEAPTRWVADVAIRLEPHIHAVQRARDLCAQALSYALSEDSISHPDFRLLAGINKSHVAIKNIVNYVVFAHGSSREDKLWATKNWIELGRLLNAEGFAIALVHGSDAEEQRSEAIAHELGNAQVLPRLGLAAMLDVLAASVGVIGVDSGLSHMAVALNLPHVQIYNFDTAWRTGPATCKESEPRPKQLSVFETPTPSINAVWLAWLRVNSVATMP
jgi:heptosyltransferase I